MNAIDLSGTVLSNIIIIIIIPFSYCFSDSLCSCFVFVLQMMCLLLRQHIDEEY